MNPYSRFSRCVFEWEGRLLSLIGHDFLNRDFQPNLLTFFVYFVVFVSLIAEWYSVANYDIETKIFGVISFLVNIQVCMPIHSILYTEIKFIF